MTIYPPCERCEHAEDEHVDHVDRCIADGCDCYRFEMMPELSAR